MRVWAYAVTHWDEMDKKTSDSLCHWRRRVDHFIDPEYTFFSLGTSSKGPSPCPIDAIVGIGLEKTKEYSNEWSYLRSGFVTGIYHALLNRGSWDVLIHVQDRTLVGEPIRPLLEEFMESDDLMFAPYWKSFFVPTDNPETGFIAFKQEGAREFVTKALRASLCPEHTISVEEECRQILGDRWMVPWPEFNTTRRRDIAWPHLESQMIDDEQFYRLPVISAGHHCSDEEREKWCELHPIKL